MSASKRSSRRRAPSAAATPQLQRGSPSPSRSPAAAGRAPAALELWLSTNPEKAWAEWFFLRYSLVWPILFGSWCVSGLHLRVGDAGNLLVTIAIGSPNILGPLFFGPPVQSDSTSGTPVTMPWHSRYWFKFNLWIAVFTFVASYFWTEYFFDVLRMNYNFPHLTWNLDAMLLGAHLTILLPASTALHCCMRTDGSRRANVWRHRQWPTAGAADDVLPRPLLLRYLPRRLHCSYPACASRHAPTGDPHSRDGDRECCCPPLLFHLVRRAPSVLQ